MTVVIMVVRGVKNDLVMKKRGREMMKEVAKM